MASEEHLAILKQGVEVWNRWREKHRKIPPDLRGAKLQGADLRGANLGGDNRGWANQNGVDLSDADLRQAKLNDASLIGIDLSRANLVGADLSSVTLSFANLYAANLTRAKLWGANLIFTNLRRAILSQADLKYAQMFGTVLTEVDLSQAKGLETVEHRGPSDIGIGTIYQSHGEIPEIFLRGVGVADNFIEYMRSLAGKPIEYYSCFISYSSKDEEFARRLYEGLQANNVRCWFAPEDLPIGEKIRPGIDQAIRRYEKLLLVLSAHSVTSDWVEQEVETAFERERQEKKLVLFPVRLDDAGMEVKDGWPAHLRRTRNIGDFTRWKDHDAYQKAFERLLRDLKVAST